MVDYPYENNPFLFLFYGYFMAILMISHLFFFPIFILANLYFIPSLPEKNRASILFVLHLF